MMFAEIALFPQQASTTASQVDMLFLFLFVVCGTVTLLVACLLVYFSVRYRRRPGEVGNPPETPSSHALEWSWTLAPLAIFMVMFVWGAEVYFAAYRPPDDAATIYVVGKQWMWKFQHPEGQREINMLHVPVGRPIRLLMTSEDVIHSLFIPDFRIHMDLLPERYTSVWFQATRPGTYHLFCSQYCGTNHAGMTGQVVAMEPADYDRWLHLGAEGSMALEGRKMFLKYRCVSCHSADADARAPVLENLFRPAGRPERRPRGRGRRELHPRIDRRPQRQDRGRLREHHADFPRPGERRRDLPVDRLHPVVEAGRDAQAGGELSAAHDDASHQHQGLDRS